MKNQEVFSKIKKSISYREADEDETSLSLILDRYRRQDHGGGVDRDAWLDGNEIDDDFQKGKRAHQEKLAKVNKILEESGFKPNASFELGEKGHFSIEIFLELK